MRAIREIILMLCLILMVGNTTATGQKQPDSIYQYLSIAAKNNPAVLQSFYEYKAALQKVPQAGGLPDPEFLLGVFVQPMELVEGKEVADLSLMQQFPWFGTLKAARDEMSMMAMAKFELFRQEKLQVFFNLKQSWYELQRIKNEIRYTENSIEILNAIERLTIVRYKTPVTNSSSRPSDSRGSMAPGTNGAGLADLYRIKIDIGDLENNKALLLNQLTSSVARFNSFLNRTPTSPVTLPDSLMADTTLVSLTLISDSLLANNPMIGMLSYEGKSLEAKKKSVTRMGYPMMGLGLEYKIISESDMSTSSMNGTDMIMPVFTMTLPIYRGKYSAMKKETEFLKNANANNCQGVVNSLQTEYYEASRLLKDSDRRMKLYDTQTNLAFKTMNILMSGLSAAEVPLTDILRVRQQILDYEFKKIEAIADYNTAIAWLQQLMAVQQIKEQ